MGSVINPIEQLERYNRDKKKSKKYLRQIKKIKVETGYAVDFGKTLRGRNGTLNNQNTFLKPSITCY